VGTTGRVLILAVLAALPVAAPGISRAEPPPREGRDDAVVVAVIDSGFSPYHWNFLGEKMPQAQDEDATNDLPLGDAPDTWLPGFPSPSSFSSYNRLQLTLDGTNPNRSLASLDTADAAKWNQVQKSTGDAVHYYYLPGTKVIGMVDFEGARVHSTSTAEHGQGTSSVSVGNIHGTCPECLLVFITIPPCPTHAYVCPELEDANNWAMRQPWIDAVSSSFGYSLLVRDRVYSRSDIRLQAEASERGQTQFFSAGNGQDGSFVAPNATLLSSQEGPDWIVTVGAVTPAGGQYSGAGKPADVASVGGSYPSAYGNTTVSNGGSFGGTSNATPVVAGMYARSLYTARRALPGPSRVQLGGLIGDEHPDPERGEAPFECGTVRPQCELQDGRLTATELRTRLFHGAVHTGKGISPAGVGDTPVATAEQQFLHEGHGSYFARVGAWAQEEGRITGPLLGTAGPVSRPAGEREWMMVDSYCRQGIWDTWAEGFFRAGVDTLPAADPVWPMRSSMAAACERATPADHRPNLVPLPPFDLEVGSSDDGQHTAIRLSVSTANRGRHALELSGVPDSVPGPEQHTTAYQCLAWTTHRACQNRRPVGRFVFHQEHLHYHFEDYANYELRRLLPNGQPDMSPQGVAAPGGKASFCLIDYDPDGPPQHPVYSEAHPLYLSCAAGVTAGVGFQGISPGWKDTYVSSLDGQQILIDDVPDGRYAVVVTADPDDRLHETVETDNVSFTAIELKNGALLPI
jgi:hypothetical protein